MITKHWRRGGRSHGSLYRAVAIAAAAALVTACGVFAPQSGPVPDVHHAEVALGHPIELASGQIRSLDHPDFDRSIADSALWAPLGMFDNGSAGIFFLEPYDPKRIPVLFVHGIRGTPRDFRRLIESLDQSCFQVWMFYYPTGFPARSVVSLLHGLLVDLEQKHRFGALFVTAHSYGGLVSASYVKSTPQPGEGVKLLVTFSSPWMGLSSAAVGAQKLPNAVPSWHDLSPGSEFLVSLREPAPPGAKVPPHYVFFGYRQTGNSQTPESSDNVVPISSQLPPWIQDQAERYWGYDATHVGILSEDAVLQRYNAVLASVADCSHPSRTQGQPDN